MCLAIPGKVEQIYEENGLIMGRISYGEAVNSACLSYVEGAKVGEYVIVHAGFAISVLDEKEALETLDLYAQITTAAAAQGSTITGQDLEESS